MPPLRRLAFTAALLLSAQLFPAQDNGDIDSEDIDTFRPSLGSLTKQKICVRCRHFLDASKAGAKFAAMNEDALQRSKVANRKHKEGLARAEAARARDADATGDPFFGYDRTDPGRQRLDAALKACLRLDGAQRQVCLNSHRPQMLVVPDPGSLNGGTMRIAVPTEGSDPRGLDADPRKVARPGPRAELRGMKPSDVRGAIAPPYASTLFLEAGAGAQRRKRRKPPVIKVPLPDLKGGGTVIEPPHYPSSPDGHEITVLAELSICVNEASRELAVSLFRGVVGREGEVECVDDPKPGNRPT